jgi:hypothetical protein
MTTSRTIGEAIERLRRHFIKATRTPYRRCTRRMPSCSSLRRPSSGGGSIRGVWASIVGSGGNTVRVATLESQDGGDWTYEVGTFEVSGPSGEVLNAGKYIVIWKQVATGETRIHRDIFNWDIPPATSTP